MDNTLEILNRCENIGKPVWIRHVLVPGLTLDRERLHQLGRLLKPYRCIQRVELLPFHKMGEYKWEALGQPYTWGLPSRPEPEQVEEARFLLQGYGLDVH